MASKRILIDCRPAHDYYISHFELAYNLPFDQLSERSYELPPRTVDFDVIINSTLLEPTKEWFLKRHKTPWPVNQFILYDDQDTTATTATTTTTTTTATNVSQHFHPNGLPVFPFSPCPLLSSELSYLQRVLRLPSSSPSSPSTTATASKTTKAPISSAHHLIVDVGCGAGRDVLTLAYAFPQHTIVAIDNLQTAIDRVSSFATRESRTNVLPYKTVLRQSGDLETSVFHALSRNNNGHGSNGSSSAGTTRDTPPSRAEILSKSSSSCSLILVSRFLKREVFLEMVALLRPGGYLLVHHFLMSCEKPKAPHHKLDRDELTRLFQDSLEVIKDDIHVGDGNRELTMWIGRKREDSRSSGSNTFSSGGSSKTSTSFSNSSTDGSKRRKKK